MMEPIVWLVKHKRSSSAGTTFFAEPDFGNGENWDREDYDVTPLVTLSAANAAIEERDKRIAELERQIVAAWNSFGATIAHSIHDVEDLDIMCGGTLDEQIKELTAQRDTAEARAEAAEAEVERLKDILGDPEGVIAHADAIQATATQAEARAASLEALVVEAGKALERFARLDKNYSNSNPCDAVFAKGCVYVSDIRAARSIVAKIGGRNE